MIKQTDPDIVEEVKGRKPSNSMRGIPVWSHDGIICAGEIYRAKFTFAQHAALNDPAGLFDESLGGSTRRAIEIRNGDALNENAFKVLICAASKFDIAK